MQIVFRKTFKKDLQKISNNTNVIRQLGDVISELEAATNLLGVHNITKMVNYKNCYRIRIGDYRLGLYFCDDVVELIHFMHRREIYKNFP